MISSQPLADFRFGVLVDTPERQWRVHQFIDIYVNMSLLVPRGAVSCRSGTCDSRDGGGTGYLGLVQRFATARQRADAASRRLRSGGEAGWCGWALVRRPGVGGT